MVGGIWNSASLSDHLSLLTGGAAAQTFDCFVCPLLFQRAVTVCGCSASSRPRAALHGCVLCLKLTKKERGNNNSSVLCAKSNKCLFVMFVRGFNVCLRFRPGVVQLNIDYKYFSGASRSF